MFLADVDDTLTGNQKGLKKLKRSLSERRDEFVLGYTSGRFKESLLEVIDQENLIEPDLIVANVGTEIFYAPDWGEDAHWSRKMRNSWIGHAAILEALSAFELQAQPHAKEFVASFYLKEKRLLPEIREALGDFPVKVVHTLSHALDIFPEAAGKGEAARYLQDKIGLPCLVAGDSENDLGFLESAWMGVLVGNAPNSLKEKLRDNPRIYQARNHHALGVLEGLRFHGVL